MCECFVIGGPFIGADPDCPAHGVDGSERQISELRDRVAGLEARLRELESRDLGLRNQTTERLGFIERRAEERRRLADEARGRALGADERTAQRELHDALVQEAHATGLETALRIVRGE